MLQKDCKLQMFMERRFFWGVVFAGKVQRPWSSNQINHKKIQDHNDNKKKQDFTFEIKTKYEKEIIFFSENKGNF